MRPRATASWRTSSAWSPSSPPSADMPLQHLGFVELPPHSHAGGFDHAAVHEPTGRIYVAHTANDALDVIDSTQTKYLGSIGKLPAVAGALVVRTPELVLTSNRGENTIAIIDPETNAVVEKIAVGIRPKGLAYDPLRMRLLVAHVGDPAVAGSCTVSIVDVRVRNRIADLPVAGRTRWSVYDPVADVFHVNIADPPHIVVVSAGDTLRIARAASMPQAGDHGLDIDVTRRPHAIVRCHAQHGLRVPAHESSRRRLRGPCVKPFGANRKRQGEAGVVSDGVGASMDDGSNRTWLRRPCPMASSSPAARRTLTRMSE